MLSSEFGDGEESELRRQANRSVPSNSHSAQYVLESWTWVLRAPKRQTGQLLGKLFSTARIQIVRCGFTDS